MFLLVLLRALSSLGVYMLEFPKSLVMARDTFLGYNQ